jgi:hypothetical protein
VVIGVFLFGQINFQRMLPPLATFPQFSQGKKGRSFEEAAPVFAAGANA